MKRAFKVVLVALLSAILAVVCVSFAGDHYGAAQMTMPSFAGATGWLNSRPLTAADLKGKVVVVDVWTYTCINWLRTLAHVRAWSERYKDQGLVVIGVHSPEFSFERDVDNVRRAAKDLRVDFPIALDNDFAVWRAFDNQYWPSLYVVDPEGRIRHHQFGEGGYEESERAIRQLLEEARHRDLGDPPAPVEGRGPEAAADWANLRSPETYVGYARGESFASPGGVSPDERRAYTVPARLRLNQWALSGEWTIARKAAMVNQAGGRIAYRFHARDVHLVMGPAARGVRARFRVLIDGQAPGAAHGGDVDDQGNGAAAEPRLYQLIRQVGPVEDRLFEIEFLDPGVSAFAFTFG